MVVSRSCAGQSGFGGLGFGINEWLVDEQYERYLNDPGSVDPTWRELFASPVPAARRPGGSSAGAVGESGGGSVSGRPRGRCVLRR